MAMKNPFPFKKKPKAKPGAKPKPKPKAPPFKKK